MAPSENDAGIIWLESADSTNSELRRRMGGLDNLSVIAAQSQSAGRGQGSHSWFSTPGKNLTFSMLLRYGDSLEVRDMLLVTCVAALGVRDYLRTHGVEARIKWPNDVWVGDRKICGILIENILDGSRIRESIVGFGVNLNESGWPEDLPNPVSLYELTGKQYDILEELPRLTKEICRRFGQLSFSDGRKSLQEEFGACMFRLP